MFYSRDYSFDFSQADLFDWAKGKFFTDYFNALSILFPVGEKFFVQAIRHFEKQLPDLDDRTLAEIKSFYQQEAKHSREHKKFNNALKAAGVDVDKLEAEIQQRLHRYTHSDPELALIATVALEQFTYALAKIVQTTGWTFLNGDDCEVSNMIRWHVMEEIEHAHVSHDVMKLANVSRLKYVMNIPRVGKELVGQLRSNLRELKKMGG